MRRTGLNAAQMVVPMKYTTTFASLELLAALTVSGLAPAAKATDMNKETIVNFPMPVEVPGRVLPAGTYVFEIADNGAMINVVQIFSEDQSRRLHLVATERTLPIEIKPADQATFFLEERPFDSPDAVNRWIYPGMAEGYEFLYSARNRQLAGNPASSPTAMAAGSSSDQWVSMSGGGNVILLVKRLSAER
jgi:hypothetical protein